VRLFARKPDGTRFSDNYIDMSVSKMEEVDNDRVLLLGYNFDRTVDPIMCNVYERTTTVSTEGTTEAIM
jgi:hypothetical protein